MTFRACVIITYQGGCFEALFIKTHPRGELNSASFTFKIKHWHFFILQIINDVSAKNICGRANKFLIPNLFKFCALELIGAQKIGPKSVRL